MVVDAGCPLGPVLAVGTLEAWLLTTLVAQVARQRAFLREARWTIRTREVLLLRTSLLLLLLLLLLAIKLMADFVELKRQRQVRQRLEPVCKQKRDEVLVKMVAVLGDRTGSVLRR